MHDLDQDIDDMQAIIEGSCPACKHDGYAHIDECIVNLTQKWNFDTFYMKGTNTIIRSSQHPKQGTPHLSEHIGTAAHIAHIAHFEKLMPNNGHAVAIDWSSFGKDKETVLISANPIPECDCEQHDTYSRWCYTEEGQRLYNTLPKDELPEWISPHNGYVREIACKKCNEIVQ
jgi:hypothetical protein